MNKTRLPDFYVPDTHLQVAGLHGSAVGGGSSWPTANKAIYIPAIFPTACTLYSMGFAANNGTGNYDIGFYDGYTKKRIASSGSIAMSAAGMKKLTFTTPIRVDPGKLYYAGLALSSGSGSVFRSNYTVLACISGGLGMQLSALPLPDPMVPATIVDAYIPLIVYGIL